MSHNKEQFVMVRLPLTYEQEHVAGDNYMDGTNDLNAFVRAIGTPIPPCADVETVGWMAKASKETLTVCREVVTNIPYNRGNHDDRVFRTDMEAQVAKVAAEKDAEIGRQTIALQNARDALVSVTEGRSEQYQARNGRWVSIQSEDGERCDIIHSDITAECEGALEVVSAVLDKGASE